MSKWTWPALAALLAVVSGSYYLLSQRQESSSASDNVDLDVEAFGDDSEGEETGDNTYELLDDGTAKTSTAVKTSTAAPVTDEQIPTIDDDDDMGETVTGPDVVDDEDGSLEAPEPKQ
jgi:hypothetical protein